MEFNNQMEEIERLKWLKSILKNQLDSIGNLVDLVLINYLKRSNRLLMAEIRDLEQKLEEYY